MPVSASDFVDRVSRDTARAALGFSSRAYVRSGQVPPTRASGSVRDRGVEGLDKRIDLDLVSGLKPENKNLGPTGSPSVPDSATARGRFLG
jgi:hypothetical protein